MVDTPAEGPYGIGSTVWPGLAKTIEEAGEVLQVLGKVVARGGDLNHRWPCPGCDGSLCGGRGYLGSGDLTDKIHEELGDLLAAIEFLVAANDDLDPNVIDIRRIEKVKTYRRWHLERTVAP